MKCVQSGRGEAERSKSKRRIRKVRQLNTSSYELALQRRDDQVVLHRPTTRPPALNLPKTNK